MTTAEISTDPKHPRRFEKKKNIPASMRTLSTGSQHDFDDAVFLVAELFVHRRRIFQARRVSNDEAGIDLAGFDPLQKRLGIGPARESGRS